jgi:hypothetical protein
MRITDGRKSTLKPTVGSLTPGTWVDLMLGLRASQKLQYRIAIILDRDDTWVQKILPHDQVALVTLAGELLFCDIDARVEPVELDVKLTNPK